MNNNTEKQPFDKQMLIAIMVAMIVWVGWQAYLGKKYPKAPKTEASAVATTEAVQGKPEEGTTSTANVGDVKKDAPGKKVDTNVAETKALETFPEKTLQYANDVWSFDVSSKGMAIRNITLHKFTDRNDKEIKFDSAAAGEFSTNIVGRAKDLDFDITHPQENQFLGVATVGGMKILKTITVDSERYNIKTQIRVENAVENFVGVVTQISDHIKPSAGGLPLMPQYEHQEMYVNHTDTNERTVLKQETAVNVSYTQTRIVSLASQYFTVAVHDQSKVMPDFRGMIEKQGDQEYAIGTLTHTRPAGSDNWLVEFTAYAGPKSYRLLDSVSPELSHIVNFGFFQAIAKIIFRVLEAIHGVVGNWGFAIILLTLLVRFLVMPFNLMSYRSMKGMAKIQPEMKSLRERYKNDPTKLNQEMLRLMKEAKANPLGGCLPMLLQIPIFFALYQVLGLSIELYKAPFIFWIHDLSYRDPFFVLPVLMGVTLFIQQKITPSTMDPAQAKVMAFLPIIFSLFMLTLPSGLTLYIFVSGLFAVVQQYSFMTVDRRKEAIS